MRKNLLRKAALFTLFVAGFTSLKAQVQGTAFSKINNGNDDVEVRGTTFDLTSSDLEIMVDGTSVQTIGIRFTNLQIPPGSIIDSAFIQFTNVGDKNPVNGAAFIRGELSANALTYSTLTQFNTRLRTADSIVWPGSTHASWGTGQPNAKTLEQRTPDLKNLVQAIVNQTGWQSGNAMAFIMTGSGVRNARSFNTLSGVHAPELIVYYTQNNYAPISFPISRGNVWRFLDNGSNQGTAWRAHNFNDSSWAFKNGSFGYGDSVNTIISFGNDSNNRHITTYFRTRVQMNNTSAFDTLILRIRRDDGIIVYINGTEVLRDNMPTGTIMHTTLALSDVHGPAENIYFEYRIPNTLVNGLNTIAVELHQFAANSNDKIFDMEILGQRVPMTIVNIPMGRTQEWYYLDDGTDQDTAWRFPNFYTGRWNYGPGILGYGDPSATTLGFGPNPNDKYITYYFVKKVNVSNLSMLTDTLFFGLIRDDGAVVYINGIEAFRDNMPSGPINYLTWSSTIVDGANERTYFEHKVPKNMFVQGINTIAVEIHQRDGVSSDLSFDMDIKNDSRQLNFLNPLNNQSVTAGQPFNITWYALPSINKVTIQLSLDNRVTWSNLATNILANTGTFTWNTPNVNNSNTWLRIVDSTNTFRDSVNIWLYPAPPAFNPCADPLHIGCFTSVPQARNQILKLPQSHIFQRLAFNGMPHNLGGTVGNNLDFTGFVSFNGSSKRGALGINEETTPGGVSVLYLTFNDTTGTWRRDSSGKVNTSDPGVVQFTRNCSGGITPWGTIITAEESYNTGDANGDGYTDVGWLVEYNPWTRRVMDYNNDGVRDKLWAMGRMNHENVVIANDSLTAYYAEDGGTSGLYKFVAFQKMRMDSGIVYVLQRNGTTGTWIPVPNATQAQRNTMSGAITGLGGTNFNGPEDVEINPLNGMIYFTSKNNGMIYRFTDNGMTISNFETYVGGPSVNYTMNVEGGGTQSVNWGSGIDNLVFDNQGNLWAQQDGGNGHIWVIRPDHTPANPKVEVFATTPAGSETSGLTFTPDFRQGFLSIMGQSSTNSQKALDAAGDSITFNVSTTVVVARRTFLGPLAAVPVEFNSFTLNKSGKNNVYVNWSTASETNNDHFIVERSVDGVNFEPIARVKGSGNSTVVNNYRYFDANLNAATYYYRIKQVDFNGSYAFSKTLSITIGDDEFTSVNVYPNPFYNEINVEFASSIEENVNVSIVDVNGKVYYNNNSKANVGLNQININTDNLTNGIYIVKVVFGNNQAQTFKLVK
ncbi:MAG: alkaline phosphatase PhoX [Bacteroidia bacterium]